MNEGKPKTRIVFILVLLGILSLLALTFFLRDNLFENKGDIKAATSSITKVDDKAIEIETIDKDPESEHLRDIRNSFAKYITVQTDGYAVSALGGISNLKLKVRNTTAYPIDNVEVQVSYIKSAGGVFKTETVYAGPIAANASVVVNAPSSSRGTSVSLNILAVSSKALGLCYVSGQKGPNLDDPYVCN